jgi:hypothetical protein
MKIVAKQMNLCEIKEIASALLEIKSIPESTATPYNLFP